jgi:hypothetical protein
MPKTPVGDMGSCEIIWGYGESGAIYLGRFLGGVKLTEATTVHEIKTDQDGDAPVDAIFGGAKFELTVPLTRTTYTILEDMLFAEKVTSGDHEMLILKNPTGCDLYDASKQIVIKPICGNVVSDDPAEWTHLFHCYPVPGMDLTIDPSTQRTFPVKFMVFVSQESGILGEAGTWGTLGMESGSTEYGI